MERSHTATRDKSMLEKEATLSLTESLLRRQLLSSSSKTAAASRGSMIS